MIRHAGDRMIPTTTKLSEEQLKGAKVAVDRRRKLLKRRLPAEESLFLMEEIEHIDALIKFNTPAS